MEGVGGSASAVNNVLAVNPYKPAVSVDSRLAIWVSSSPEESLLSLALADL